MNGPRAVDAVLQLGAGAPDRRRRLRALLNAGEPFVVPGITDAMGGLLVDKIGFGACYATGAGLANLQFGLPDIGLTSLPDLAEHVERITNTASTPLLVDADTGFGGPLSAARTVRRLERAGAAGIQLEDQEMPKRCGHFDEHTLIPPGHMQNKIAAVLQAREDDDLVVIARTDARSAHGLDEAIERAKAYRDAGADALFLEAPRSVEELEQVGRALPDVPLVVNVVEGGKTPALTLEDYGELGFTLVLYANFLMRAMQRAGEEALQHLHKHGDSLGHTDRIATWQERQQLFRLPEFSAAEAHFDRPWEGGQP